MHLNFVKFKTKKDNFQGSPLTPNRNFSENWIFIGAVATINLAHALEGRVPPLPAIAPLRAMAKARRIASGKEFGCSKGVFPALAS